MSNRFGLANLGLGLGLRSPHFNSILKDWPAVDWFEIISENFMDTGGRPRYVLDQIAERYPVVMHGVSMSIGSSQPLDFEYLRKLKRLADRISPVWISDHLCWTGVAGLNTHDLLPLPLTQEALEHVVERICIVQDFLERPLILENPSTYLEFEASTIDDWTFLGQMAEEADCGLLLDVNNIYVCSRNHGWDPVEYVRSVPPDRVVQFHLAGHQDNLTHLIDTHDRAVIDQVWDLYAVAHKHIGGASTLLEWDASIPPIEELMTEVAKAKNFMDDHSLRPCREAGAPLENAGARRAAETAQAFPHPLHLMPID